MSADQLKNIGDVTAGGVTVATVVGWLPSIAAALTIVYTAFRLYVEVTNYLEKRRKKKYHKE